jgi:signal peptidase I
VKRGSIEYGHGAVGPNAPALLAQAFVIKPCHVLPQSPRSRLRPGGRALIGPIAHRLREPRRGGVIVVRFREDREIVLTRPVVGLPNDTLQVSNGRRWVSERCQTVNGVTQR